MEAELKQKWTTALLYGDYQQGQSRLRQRKEDGTTMYCCLGVLCDVADSSKWNMESKDNSHYWNGAAWCYDKLDTDPTSYGYINSRKLNDFGLSEDKQRELALLNDSERKSFAEIAKWIEENI